MFITICAGSICLDVKGGGEEEEEIDIGIGAGGRVLSKGKERNVTDANGDVDS